MTLHDPPLFAFLFTDIQGSTRSWEEDPRAMASLVEEHDLRMQEAVASNGGKVIKQTGDGVFAVFDRAVDALSAAIEAQLKLPRRLKARMGIHTGSAIRRGDDYFGNDVNRTARLMAIA
ncbi:MAG: adenylate/guanylate cyclase domain-containing protein, partial [Acidimicrobiia bacterium]|nr:adenylate/guanylate cyclase domain-containing protein [Acidimicrobiia bacterium]